MIDTTTTTLAAFNAVRDWAAYADADRCLEAAGRQAAGFNDQERRIYLTIYTAELKQLSSK